MSLNSAIEWTDATWNPTTGCDRVSPGCDHCYALSTVEDVDEPPDDAPDHHDEDRDPDDGIDDLSHDATVRVGVTKPTSHRLWS